MAKDVKLVRGLVEEVMDTVQGWLETKMPDDDGEARAKIVCAALNVCDATASNAAGIDRDGFLKNAGQAFDDLEETKG